MNYFKTDIKWEDEFVQEAIDLEEKLTHMDVESLGKSKLRMLFENKLLDWNKYQSWLCHNIGCSCFKNSIDNNQISHLKSHIKETYNSFSTHDFWSDDLIPVFVWEGNLYVFGLEYNSKLSEIQNHVFILTPPEILHNLAKEIFKDKNADNLESSSGAPENSAVDKIEGLDLDYKSPTAVDFKSIPLPGADGASQMAANESIKAPAEKIKNEDSIWEFINERHDEISFEAKKQFSAYIVLKIKDNKTQVYKMDSELRKKNLNDGIFNYSLNDDNPFARVAKSGVSESFGLSQLNLNILDFKYACITALKVGKQTVGFLVGFKNSNLSDNDLTLLEELADESAA